MKRIHTIATLIAVVACCVAATAPAQLAPDVSADIGLFNKYVWRGLIVNDGPVLQPDAMIGLGGASIGAWANVDVDDVNDRSGEVTEVDTWIDYGFGVGLASINAGFVHYGYPDAGGDTSELYLVGSAGVLFSPTLSLYRDVDLAKGLYANFAVSHGLALTPAQTLDLTAAVGFGDDKHNQHYYAGSGSGTADLGLTASWTWAAAPLVSVTPMVTYTTLLGDASDAVDASGADTSAVVFGVMASFSF
ncbi:MAG: hypothetical protein GY838_12020 [bacterium]|nr:hypothetical protein [bacterium]